MSVGRLERVALLIRRYLPQGSIGIHARVNSLERKSVDDLRRLHELGYDGITVGIAPISYQSVGAQSWCRDLQDRKSVV